VINNIEKIIENPNVPINILKVVLNLSEFMEHDTHGLQIDITCLANLAERCNEPAKALYYREFEFEYNSEDTIDKLLNLYSILGQEEAADGILTIAKKMPNIKLKSVQTNWLQSLERCQEALQEYESRYNSLDSDQPLLSSED
jgi:hypothetical protein